MKAIIGPKAKTSTLVLAILLPLLLVSTALGQSSMDFVKLTIASSPEYEGYGVAWSESGTYVATVSNWDLTVYQRDGDTFTKLAAPDVIPENVNTAVAWSPDGSMVVVGSEGGPNGGVHVYSFSGGTTTKLHDLPGLTGPVYDIAFSPDGQYLAVGGGLNGGSPFHVYSVSGTTFTMVTAPAGDSDADGFAVAWTPDSRLLTYAVEEAFDPRIRTYEMTAGVPTRLPDPIEQPADGVSSVHYSPDDGGHLVLTTGLKIVVYHRDQEDVHTKVAEASLGANKWPFDADWNPAGTRILVAHDRYGDEPRTSVRVYDFDGVDTLTMLTHPTYQPAGTAEGVAWSPTGGYAAVAHYGYPEFLTIYSTGLGDPPPVNLIVPTNETTYTAVGTGEQVGNYTTYRPGLDWGLRCDTHPSTSGGCVDSTHTRGREYDGSDTTFVRLLNVQPPNDDPDCEGTGDHSIPVGQGNVGDQTDSWIQYNVTPGSVATGLTGSWTPYDDIFSYSKMCVAVWFQSSINETWHRQYVQNGTQRYAWYNFSQPVSPAMEIKAVRLSVVFQPGGSGWAAIDLYGLEVLGSPGSGALPLIVTNRTSSIGLAWLGVTNATSYDIQRNSTTAPSYATVASALGSGVRGWDDTNVTNGQAYRYRLVPKLTDMSGFAYSDLDSSGYANHIEFKTGTGHTESKIPEMGRAITFNATNNHYARVADANSLDLATGYTIAGFANRTAHDGVVRYILQKQDAYNVFFDSSNRLNCGIKHNAGISYILATADSSSYVTPGEWFDFACVFDDTANTLRLYIDGVQRGTVSHNFDSATNTWKLFIGNSVGGATAGFRGSIDELTIAATPWDATQRADFRARTWNGTGSDVRARYTFDVPALVTTELPHVGPVHAAPALAGLVGTLTPFPTLSWSVPSVENLTGYRILRDGIAIAQVTGTTFTDGNTSTGGNYSVAWVASTGPGPATAPVSLVPDVAVTLDATDMHKKVKLTWDHTRNLHPTSFEVYRNGTLLATVPARIGIYYDGDFAANELCILHPYTVVAVTSVGEVPSNTVLGFPFTYPEIKQFGDQGAVYGARATPCTRPESGGAGTPGTPGTIVGGRDALGDSMQVPGLAVSFIFGIIFVLLFGAVGFQAVPSSPVGGAAGGVVVGVIFSVAASFIPVWLVLLVFVAGLAAFFMLRGSAAGGGS